MFLLRGQGEDRWWSQNGDGIVSDCNLDLLTLWDQLRSLDQQQSGVWILVRAWQKWLANPWGSTLLKKLSMPSRILRLLPPFI